MDECCLRCSPGTAGNCTGCCSRTGSTAAGRSCKKSFPAAGLTVCHGEPEHQPVVGLMSLCGSLEKIHTKINGVFIFQASKPNRTLCFHVSQGLD